MIRYFVQLNVELDEGKKSAKVLNILVLLRGVLMLGFGYQRSSECPASFLDPRFVFVVTYVGKVFNEIFEFYFGYCRYFRKY